MKKTKFQIISDFDAHLQKSSKEYYRDFYVGITNDIERRLYTEHNVCKDNAWWIWREATNKATAQAVVHQALAQAQAAGVAVAVAVEAEASAAAVPEVVAAEAAVEVAWADAVKI